MIFYRWRMRRLCKRNGHVWVKQYNVYGNAVWYECSVCWRRR